MFPLGFSGSYVPTAGLAYLKYIFTVIGFTKFKGLFSLNGKVKPVFESNLGALGFFSTSFGSYYPGPRLILGSLLCSSPALEKRSAFDTKPFPVP